MDLNEIAKSLPHGVSMTIDGDPVDAVALYVNAWGEEFNVAARHVPVVVSMISTLLAVQCGEQLDLFEVPAGEGASS